MAEWRTFNASNDEGTCLWCGNKLRLKVLESHKEIVREVPLDENHPDYWPEHGITTRKIYKTVHDKVAEKPGDYEDGFFCGLRCAYQFAVRMAELGRRFNPRG